MRDTESIAQHVIESLTPGAVLAYNEGQDQGEPDFFLHCPGSGPLPLEVTSSRDQKHIETVAAIRGTNDAYFLDRTLCAYDWIIEPSLNANIRRLRRHVDEYLAAVETEGVSRFFAETDWHRYASVRRIARDLGVRYGSHCPWKPSGRIGLLQPSAGGWVSPQALQSVVEEVADRDDNRKKLEGGGHLVVYVHFTSFIPWLVLNDEKPPKQTPRLPPEVSTLWAVATTRSGAHVVVWRVRRGQEWENLGTLSVPGRAA